MLDSTLAVVLCSGIPMNANAIPLQLQLPAKYFTSFSFGFGPGGASMARRVEAAKTRAMVTKSIRFIEVLLSVMSARGREADFAGVAYLIRVLASGRR